MNGNQMNGNRILMMNGNRLSLVRDECGFLLLALDGKIIPGQCALEAKDNSSPRPEDPRRMSVTVIFEVDGDVDQIAGDPT